MSARLLHTVAIAIGMLSSFAWASTSGTVLFSRGDVRIVDGAGKSRPATRGTPVKGGERIVAPPGTVSQIRLIDGSLIGVRPDTEFRIELPPRAADQAQHIVSLLRGGVRVINLDTTDGQARLPVMLKTASGNVSLFAGDVESFYLPPGGKSAHSGESGSYTRLISGAGSVRNTAAEVPLTVRTVAYLPTTSIAPAVTTSFASTMFMTPVFTTALSTSTVTGTKATTSGSLATSLASTSLSTSTSLTTSLSPMTSTLTSPTLLTSTSLSTSNLLSPTTTLSSPATTLSSTSLSTATFSSTATLSPTAILSPTIQTTLTPITYVPKTITYVPPPPVYVAPTVTTTTIKCTVKCR
jgi:hypothetical protein